MIHLLKILIFGHVHKWALVEKETLARARDPNAPVGYRFITKCETCGAYKHWTCC